jgi:hypothetical protein
VLSYWPCRTFRVSGLVESKGREPLNGWRRIHDLRDGGVNGIASTPSGRSGGGTTTAAANSYIMLDEANLLPGRDATDPWFEACRSGPNAPTGRSGAFQDAEFEECRG